MYAIDQTLRKTKRKFSVINMKPITFSFLLFIIFFSSCVNKSTSNLKSIEIEKNKQKANIRELEMEINNGGFNQYFFNSSGQNCFATLKELQKRGKIKTAKILEKAISLINPKNLSQEELIEKLKKREVEELDDEKISLELEKLDNEFYKYPDGALE